MLHQNSSRGLFASNSDRVTMPRSVFACSKLGHARGQRKQGASPVKCGLAGNRNLNNIGGSR